jgi:hypothetical protein
MALKTIARYLMQRECVDGDPHLRRYLQEVALRGIAPSSQKTFIDFLLQAEEMISKALDVRNIKQGWKVSGLWPYHPEVVLKQCPRFETISKEQAAALFASLHPLAVLMQQNGQLTDAQMQHCIGAAFDLEKEAATSRAQAPSAKEVHELTPNRRRACIINKALIQKDDDGAGPAAGPAAAASESSDGRYVCCVCVTVLGSLLQTPMRPLPRGGAACKLPAPPCQLQARRQQHSRPGLVRIVQRLLRAAIRVCSPLPYTNLKTATQSTLTSSSEQQLVPLYLSCNFYISICSCPHATSWFDMCSLSVLFNPSLFVSHG